MILFTLSPICILCGIFYSASSHPLSHIGLGDLFVGIFFGPIGTIGSYFLQTHKIDFLPILASIIPTFFVIAILTINNLRDIQEDRKANKKTLVVILGKTFGQYEYLFSIVLICIAPLFLAVYTNNFIITLLLFLFFLFFPLIKKTFSYKDEFALNAILYRVN